MVLTIEIPSIVSFIWSGQVTLELDNGTKYKIHSPMDLCPNNVQLFLMQNVNAPFQGRAKAMAREERRMEENTKTVIQMA